MRLSRGLCAQIACILEVSAPKPGNVHRTSEVEGGKYLDFLLSACAIAPTMERAHERGLGATVLEAVERTQAIVKTNTNLGIVLLLAPLAAVYHAVDLRTAIGELLLATTVEDARLVYRAIRLAKPGGLGEAKEEDVRGEPSRSLREVMELAGDRDLIARQYGDGFSTVFDIGVPALADAQTAGLSSDDTVVLCHLRLLSRFPDSLIARKSGAEIAAEASHRARSILEANWPDSEEAREELERFDRWLRDDGNRRNPGTTADLVAASLFVALRAGVVPIPFSMTA